MGIDFRNVFDKYKPSSPQRIGGLIDLIEVLK